MSLTQEDANLLINVIKVLTSTQAIELPSAGKYIELEAAAKDDAKEKVLIDVNRKGAINVKKATFQTRYQRTTILLRLDIESSNHTNPDGEVIPCPHLHIYREGFEDKWAYPLARHILTDTSDLVQVLVDFLRYNNIENIPGIHHAGLLF